MVLYLRGATMGTSINIHFTQNNVMKCHPCDTLCNVTFCHKNYGKIGHGML